METVVLIPGIMGSKLILPPTSPGGKAEEVWPPTPLETQFGYERIDKLQDPRVLASEMIDKVLCFSFYGTIKDLMHKLGYTNAGTQKRLVEFPYDWRQDNFSTAERLAERLDELHSEGATNITLIGHSMGGLIARLVMEQSVYATKPWFNSIKLFLALATPHLGAPLALARIFGLDSTLGISGADFAQLARDTRYPSGYQLIPAPGELAIWDLNSPDVAPLDVYDERTAKRLGLDPKLVARAKAIHDVLSAGRRPPHVRYFYFAGSGHRTVTRINVAAEPDSPVNHQFSVVTRTPHSGDGTVPLYSALPVSGQRQIIVNEHATVFEGAPFRHIFARLLGGDEGPALEGLAEEARAAETKVALSLDSPVQRVGQSIELTLSVFDDTARNKQAGVDTINGTIVLDLMQENEQIRRKAVREIPVSYFGPSIDRLSMLLRPIGEAGLYRLRFEGNPPATAVKPFAVSSV